MGTVNCVRWLRSSSFFFSFKEDVAMKSCRTCFHQRWERRAVIYPVRWSYKAEFWREIPSENKKRLRRQDGARSTTKRIGARLGKPRRPQGEEYHHRREETWVFCRSLLGGDTWTRMRWTASWCCRRVRLRLGWWSRWRRPAAVLSAHLSELVNSVRHPGFFSKFHRSYMMYSSFLSYWGLWRLKNESDIVDPVAWRPETKVKTVKSESDVREDRRLKNSEDSY